MSLPPPLQRAVESALAQPVRAARRVSGGDLNDAWRVELADGSAAFVKTAADARPGGYTAEAEGLRWLAEPGALAVPTVLATVDPHEADHRHPFGADQGNRSSAERDDPFAADHGDAPSADHPGPRLLALQWVEEGRLDGPGEEALGRGLAAVHQAGAATFGAGPRAGPEHAPLHLGPLELPNDPAPSWPEFYAERRLKPLARLAAAKGHLSDSAERDVDRVCERLPELAGPAEPPARLHGDLWSGNVLAGRDGHPWLVDPAAYGGHRELDLAMLRLFGGPSNRCFAAYAEVAPPAEGHAERVELWQLFPLLVHALLFGGGYGTSVARIARRLA